MKIGKAFEADACNHLTLRDVRVGMEVQADDGFNCIAPWAILTVQQSDDGRLYVTTNDGSPFFFDDYIEKLGHGCDGLDGFFPCDPRPWDFLTLRDVRPGMEVLADETFARLTPWATYIVAQAADGRLYLTADDGTPLFLADLIDKQDTTGRLNGLSPFEAAAAGMPDGLLRWKNGLQLASRVKRAR